MSRKDLAIDKGPQFGNNRSKALNATKKVWNVNLHKITIIVDGKKIKAKLSASSIRTLKNKGKLGKSNFTLAIIKDSQGKDLKVLIDRNVLERIK